MSGYAQDITQVFPLGPAKLYTGTYPGVNLLGHTDESGIKLSLKGTLVTMMVAKYGKASVGEFLAGQQGEIDCVLMQTDMTILGAAFPGVTVVTNTGGNKKLTFGVTAGTKVPIVTLTIVPEQSLTPVSNWTCQASPVGDFDPVYEGGKWTGYKAKFRVIINEAGASNGSWVGQFGDATITADTVAPTVSGVVPANAATGVSTSTTVVATISKALMGNTVTTGSVTLIKDPQGTPTQIQGTVALLNNGSSTTITFTPSSALTAAKDYVFLLNGDVITDQAGNFLASGAGFSSYFAT